MRPMLPAAGLFLIGPLVVAASPEPLTKDALTKALLFDGESNYRPIVHYDMRVKLDPDTKELDGQARIRWKNDGSWPVSKLWWHLYLNAFRNQSSTFFRESGGRLRSDRVSEDSWGWTDVTEMTVRYLSTTGTAGQERHDLMPAAKFEAPDDGNRDDRTVLTTRLPYKLSAGGEIEINLKWKAKLPKVFARSGYAGSFFMVAQWFPKLGVLEESFRGAEFDFRGEPKWNCHQYHANSEFFADYGSYRVRITVPNDYIVGATGKRVEDPVREDGWTTYEYYQDRVHDFAWTADPRYVVRRFTFNPSTLPAEDVAEAAAQLGLTPDELQLTRVDVTMLLQPEHRGIAARYRAAIEHSLTWFGLWFGRYPYSTLTLVDGPPEGQGAMGMEYPTLITGGVRWPSPPETNSPETVTVHEFGHQFWYGMVGFNEFEEAWLDEGINTFSTSLIMDKVYGSATFAPRLLGVPMVPWFKTSTVSNLDRAQIGNIVAADTDAIAQHSWSYQSSLSYGLNSYLRAELALRQLGHIIGPDTVLQGLRVFQQRWRYRHPTTIDLQVAMEQVCGCSLSTFFEEAIGSARRLDYSIDEVTSRERDIPAGVFERTGPDGHRVVSSSVAAALTDERPDDERVYINEVLITRRGERIEPLTVEVKMSEGPPYRATWDGVTRWHRISFESKERAVSARLYAEVPRPIDARPSNDSMLREADSIVGLSWAARAMYWLQSVLQLVGGLL